ncbi:rubrerythrin [Clostridium sp. SM-530-WT-3G]|uniref:rubrerythrin n=1 Tax=Clostridium sp. SM-530-WT-3G TaxID=2725303 RepID=UPI00145ED60A|nr:rubrerythrin family protein [Clostridium sp. SM-530-WT-3G]NME84368.1 rubrerythrin family protein [Clostridium sp. SM-530-WT-3G]
MNLRGSKTAKNLIKAFAGECQARTRYTYYSDIAKKEGYVQISNIFLETAEQEREHAKLFYKFLKQDYCDECIEINAAYPVSFHDKTKKNLIASAEAEKAEWTKDYQNFAKIAKSEGFMEIALTFKKIALIEKMHDIRYRKLLRNVENGTVFKKDREVLWKCNNCGFIYEGCEAPKTCPACNHPQGYFEVFGENY